MGAAALEPALAAVARGATVALANKECIVAAGSVFHRALANSTASRHPGRFRAQRGLPGAERRRRSGSRKGHAHRVGRSVPRLDHSNRWPCARWSRRSRIPTGRWAQDFRRQRHLDEQGPRTDRGAFSLRAAGREAGRAGASAVDRALPGFVRGRLDARASLGAGHAHADRACAGLAAPHCFAVAPARSGASRPAHIPRAGSRAVPLPRPRAGLHADWAVWRRQF